MVHRTSGADYLDGVEADDHSKSNGTKVSGEGDGNLQSRLAVRTSLKRYGKSNSGEDLTIQSSVDVNCIHWMGRVSTRMAPEILLNQPQY
jgi:autotransporter family porin